MIGGMKDWLIKSRDNYKEYRNSQEAATKTEIEGLRMNTPLPQELISRPFWTRHGQVHWMTEKSWGCRAGEACWKSTLWGAGRICSLGGVLPEALYYKTTPGGAGESSWWLQTTLYGRSWVLEKLYELWASTPEPERKRLPACSVSLIRGI